LKAFESRAACRAAVIGVGLIGGSLAARLRRSRPSWTIVGYDISPEAGERALRMGLVQEITPDRAAALAGADVVILAPPVSAILEILSTLEREIAGEAFVIDVGSTKRLVVEAMDRLPERIQCVGGHPMTGPATAGVSEPDAGLFEGRRFVVSRTRTTRVATLTGAVGLASDLGAEVVEMDAAEHDAAVALVSHLPYLVPLPLLAAFREANETTRSLAAGGFKSRVAGAGANVPMWWDILRTNRAAIRAALGGYRDQLDRIDALLANGSEEELRELLTGAAREAAEITGA